MTRRQMKKTLRRWHRFERFGQSLRFLSQPWRGLTKARRRWRRDLQREDGEDRFLGRWDPMTAAERRHEHGKLDAAVARLMPRVEALIAKHRAKEDRP